MNVPSLEGTAAFEWSFFYNENGYYDAATKFEELVGEIEESDIDLTQYTEDYTAEEVHEEIEEELGLETLAALTTFSTLSINMLDQWVDEDLDEMLQAEMESSITLGEYVDEED